MHKGLAMYVFADYVVVQSSPPNYDHYVNCVSSTPQSLVHKSNHIPQMSGADKSHTAVVVRHESYYLAYCCHQPTLVWKYYTYTTTELLVYGMYVNTWLTPCTLNTKGCFKELSFTTFILSDQLPNIRFFVIHATKPHR